MLVDLGRAADLLDPPGVEHGDAVAHRQRLALVVGDVDEGDADLALDRLELDLHLLAQLEVERAERLVEQQHARPVDQRPGERHALALAARELRRPALPEAAERHHRQHLLGPAPALFLRHAADHQSIGDVVRHVHVGKQGIVLEHGVDVALIGRDAGHRTVVDADLAGRWLLEPGDQPEAGGLARARRA